MNKSKYRHELKHSISGYDMVMLTKKLELAAVPDENMRNGSYKVRSLYFDSFTDSVLRDKLDGISVREKFRIRFYNMDDSFIRLEKKTKRYGLCLKESAPLSRELTERIIRGDTGSPDDAGVPLVTELCVKMLTESLRPKVIVDYTRRAYVFPYGNVRITFDSSITSSYDTENFFERSSEIPASGEIVMEIKYDEFLPDVIAQLVRQSGRQSGSFSKYAAARFL
ncbi:MAG: polyphosphate polymerase domain-containing protein [Ruminococcus sp.]|nr:polyphosphate polymerase domain-containing protein [Ruminococcus sp.]